MKRSIILFATALLVMVGWSQTMTINFKDGSVVNQNVSNITSFEITGDKQDNNDNQSGDDNQGDNQEVSKTLFGTWKITKVEKGLQDLDLRLSYIQFNSDGTWFGIRFKDNNDNLMTISKGTWHVLDNNLIVNTKEGDWALHPFAWAIKKGDSKELILSCEIVTEYFTHIATAYLSKVDDSEIEKYLPSDFTRTYYCQGGYDIMMNKSLTIDGVEYYASNWSAAYEPSTRVGKLYLNIDPHEDVVLWTPVQGKRLKINLDGKYVLKQNIGVLKIPENTVFIGDGVSRSIVEGSVEILEITEYYMTIRFNKIKLKGLYDYTIYDGTVILNSGTWGGATTSLLPFKKPND